MCHRMWFSHTHTFVHVCMRVCVHASELGSQQVYQNVKDPQVRGKVNNNNRSENVTKEQENTAPKKWYSLGTKLHQTTRSNSHYETVTMCIDTPKLSGAVLPKSRNAAGGSRWPEPPCPRENNSSIVLVWIFCTHSS